MEKKDRNKRIPMKEIENIYDEMDKGSTGIFKDKYGHSYYLLNGKEHRSDGPAIECADGTKVWLFHGKCHRSNGPAEIWVSGMKRWWYYDNMANSEKQFYDSEWRKRIEIMEFL